jgi:hypothetical protein
MKKIYGLILLAVLGCADNHIRTTYGEWKTDTVYVQIVEGNTAKLVYKDKVFSVPNKNYKVGQRTNIQFRYVYTSHCENNHCELIKTQVEIK